MIVIMTECQNDIKPGQKKKMCAWFAFVSTHFIDDLIFECTFGVMKYLVYSFHANSLQYLEFVVLWISL